MSKPMQDGVPTWTLNGVPTWTLIWLWLIFASFCMATYWPALGGEFISDDRVYISESPYTESLDSKSLIGLVAPFGDAHANTVNYAPVHLVLHALQRQLFGYEVLGYHLTNILLHALNSVLLVALLLVSRIPERAAVLGGAVFLLHPANVEAVAWMSQLKTVSAMTLALIALLVHRRWPIASVVPFALALLAKASAFFALPFALALLWARGGSSRRHGAALALWGVVFALYLVPQFAAHSAALDVEVEAYADLGVHLRSMAAYGARYLVMAVTSYGVAPFQQPEPALSFFDPWWLAALVLGALLSWRLWLTFRGLREGRREEAAWWVAAAAGFAPVSQWLPFQSAVADRYLYFILPGLIGAVLLLMLEVGERLGSRSVLWFRGLAIATATLLLFFGASSYDRARDWQFETFLLAEGARHNPNTVYAKFEEGIRFMKTGDAPSAVIAFRESVRRGLDPRKILTDARLVPLHEDPEFNDFMRFELERWLEDGRINGWSSRPRLAAMAQVELSLGRPDEAVELLERAAAAAGPFEEPVKMELAALKEVLAASE